MNIGYVCKDYVEIINFVNYIKNNLNANFFDLTEYKDATLKDLTLDELKDLAKEKNIKNISKKSKDELIEELEETE